MHELGGCERETGLRTYAEPEPTARSHSYPPGATGGRVNRDNPSAIQKRVLNSVTLLHDGAIRSNQCERSPGGIECSREHHAVDRRINRNQIRGFAVAG